MAANLEIAGSVKRVEPGDVDWYYGGGSFGWDDLASAKAGVPSPIRPGKTVGVIIDNEVKEYIWHPGNITDEGLVLKVSGGGGGSVGETPPYTTYTFTEADQDPVNQNIEIPWDSTKKALHGDRPVVVDICVSGGGLPAGSVMTSPAQSMFESPTSTLLSITGLEENSVSKTVLVSILNKVAVMDTSNPVPPLVFNFTEATMGTVYTISNFAAMFPQYVRGTIEAQSEDPDNLGWWDVNTDGLVVEYTDTDPDDPTITQIKFDGAFGTTKRRIIVRAAATVIYSEGSDTPVPLYNDATDFQQLAQVEAAYPSAAVGQEIYYQENTDGPLIARKGFGGKWYWMTLSEITNW